MQPRILPPCDSPRSTSHYVLNENFEDAKALFLPPLMAIHRAHLVMLAEHGHRLARRCAPLRDALDAVSRGRGARRARYDGTCEDLFFYVERLLVEACGEDVAGRLHTARSRNDIDMTMYRMRQREFMLELVDGDARAAREPARRRRARTATRSSRRTRTRSPRSRPRSPTTCWR